MTDLPIGYKAAIGAIGGLALAILKLIDAQFYLVDGMSTKAVAAYLTYFCYMVLGSVTAVFLADHELPTQKVRRSAFVLGLLAPSVLLAIANQPFKVSGSGDVGTRAQIPALSWLPISSAEAQTRPETPGEVEVVPKTALQPTFGNAFAAAWGRKDIVEPYALVVGSTTDKAKALETASKLDVFLKGASAPAGKYPAFKATRVLQVEGLKTYYVVVGDLESKESVWKSKTDTSNAAFAGVSSERPEMKLTAAEKQSLAKLLWNAPVIKADSLTRPAE